MCTQCPPNDAMTYRHRYEKPLLTLAKIITFSSIAIGIFSIITFDDAYLEEHSWLLAGLTLLIATMPMVFVYRYYLAAQMRANCARVSPDQFPEIWSIYSDLLKKIQLDYEPALYIQNGNGVVNAFAFSCSLKRNYIILHAEIAVCCDEHPEIVQFVLAHELAHHKLGHTRLSRNFFSYLMDLMVLPGKALSRAQEYSADRLALAICPDAADSILFLLVGPWMAGRTNPKAFETQAEQDKNCLMIRLANVAQTHPVMSKRYQALLDISRNGFGTHGSMF